MKYTLIVRYPNIGARAYTGQTLEEAQESAESVTFAGYATEIIRETY
jgi:hypothetical protein